jgi:hypothetical protein
MAITAQLPEGFIELTSPVAVHARQLLVMIAHTTAFQEWCGVGRWQDACAFLDMVQAETQATEQGERISSPNVLLTFPNQEWAPLDGDRVLFRGCQFDLFISAQHGQVSLDQSFLEFTERVGRVIAGIGQLAGTDEPDTTRTWPLFDSLTEAQPPVLDETDGYAYWSTNWQAKLRGRT